jgi:hypothetical protein
MSEKDKLLDNFDVERYTPRDVIPEFLKQIDSKYRYICCCRYGLKNIKEHHIRSYIGLKELATVSYNENNDYQENSLKSLYTSVIDHEPTETLIHSNWSNIGFQV